MRALVTGGSKRVGRAISLELGRSGFEVLVHHRSSPVEGQEVVEQIRAEGGRASLVAADLATADGCTTLVQAAAKLGGLELLVHNASRFDPLPFEQITDGDWEAMLAVNLMAPFRVTRDLLPTLRAGTNPLVIHICDIGADRPVSGYAHYSVSKAGLVMLVKAMAVELAPEIRTVGISPGQVAWPPDYSEAKREVLRKRIPLQRCGSPESIATLVRFVALEGDYIHGEIIAVDGGLSAKY